MCRPGTAVTQVVVGLVGGAGIVWSGAALLDPGSPQMWSLQLCSQERKADGILLAFCLFLHCSLAAQRMEHECCAQRIVWNPQKMIIFS